MEFQDNALNRSWNGERLENTWKYQISWISSNKSSLHTNKVWFTFVFAQGEQLALRSHPVPSTFPAPEPPRHGGWRCAWFELVVPWLEDQCQSQWLNGASFQWASTRWCHIYPYVGIVEVNLPFKSNSSRNTPFSDHFEANLAYPGALAAKFLRLPEPWAILSQLLAIVYHECGIYDCIIAI